MAKKGMHDAEGRKIAHPADAERRKHKKRKLEKFKKTRKDNFEQRMLLMSPESIEMEIRALTADFARKRAHKIEITKMSLDHLARLESNYAKMKDSIEERHEKRMAEPKASHHIDFDELKVHRKSSIYYHPVNNPYGAPPTGQTLMYRHPDGSVKREPPPLAETQTKTDDRHAAGSDNEDEDENSDDDDSDAEPMLPSTLPGGFEIEIETSASSTMPPLLAGLLPIPAGMPPLPAGQPPMPTGMPPLPGGQLLLATDMPPLPAGMPPLPVGLPPLPAGMPPLHSGVPPFAAGTTSLPTGMPPLPSGMPLLPAGMPPLPSGKPPSIFGAEVAWPAFPGLTTPLSQIEFQAELQQAGVCLPPGVKPPGPPPKHGALVDDGEKGKGKGKGKGKMKDKGKWKNQDGWIDAETVVVDLPAGVKAPPPPPKFAAMELKSATPEPKGPNAQAFVPTTLRTKRPSQLAGGAIQVSSASLSQEKRQSTLFQESPAVAGKVDLDDAMTAFLSEVG